MRRVSIIGLLIIAIGIAGYFVYSDIHTQAQAQSAATPAVGNAGQGGPVGGRQGGRGGRGLARLTSELSLTPAQVALIKPIMKDERSQMEAIRNNATLTDDQQKAAMLNLREATNQKIKPILTPAQIAKYKAIQAQQRARFAAGGGQMGGRQGG